MVSKKCKDDEILNPDTNRCVKRNGSVGKKVLAEMNKKKCKEDEILNPTTNRCVKRTGSIGKKILSELNKKKSSRKSKKRSSRKSKKRSSRKSKKNKDDCNDEQILNPKTNRCVSIYGELGKQLLKEEFERIREYKRMHPKIYYPPNKVLYKGKLATITCRYYGRADVLNTYGIIFDETGKNKEFVHHDDLVFVHP